MEKSIELPIHNCDLSVTVGRDGVWLHFGKYAVIHVHNTLGDKGNIISRNVNDWCLDRQRQAKNMV